MLSESTSTISGNTDGSDDSLLSEKVLAQHIRGLPDIFVPSGAWTRPVVQKHEGREEITFSLETNDLICRICHGGDSSGDLLTPCRCKGSIALAHLRCLEIWLTESNRNDCELCKYHFRVVREPKYGVLRSVFVFLRHPGEHARELLVDVVTLGVYTPSTITSTYMLMLLCESLAKSNPQFKQTFLSHVIGFSSVFGIAVINFTYTSWIILTLEKYIEYWRDWYRQTCTLKVILSANKLNQNSTDSNPPALS